MVLFPPHPIRTADDVLRFMDYQQGLARDAVRDPFFGSIGPVQAGRAMRDGIAAAWLWLVAKGFECGPMQDLPEGLPLSDKFRDIYTKVRDTEVPPSPPAELLHKIARQQREILKYLWDARHATNWDSLPQGCWRTGQPTCEQEDRTVKGALERLRDKLNNLQEYGLTLEVHSANRTTKLVRNA